METPQTDAPAFWDRVDRGIRWLGRSVSWLNAVLIGVIIVQVILRYVFGRGMVILEEIQWHLYAVGFMIGMSYTLTTDANIRLDILYSRFSRRTQAKVDIFGTLFLLMPFIVVFFLHSLDFVANSWRVGERSDAPMGLPYRWAIKAVIPVSFTLLFIAATSRIAKAFALLKSTAPKDNDGNP